MNARGGPGSSRPPIGRLDGDWFRLFAGLDAERAVVEALMRAALANPPTLPAGL